MLPRSFPAHASARFSRLLSICLYCSTSPVLRQHSEGVAQDGRSMAHGAVKRDREVPWVPRAPQGGGVGLGGEVSRWA